MTIDVSLAPPGLAEVEALLYHEARLLDDGHLAAWLDLFADDGVYWIPIDDTRPNTVSASIVYDHRIALEERVYHLLHVPFVAQSPRSRTVHLVSNIEIVEAEGPTVRVRSNQVIYEMRRGDFRQVGLGDVHANVAAVEHLIAPHDGAMTIRRKKVMLIDRDVQQRNLTFLL
jgi:3-phenylpropionate/cinnamic acid dioxygenase small subunit